jgi:hypothetical protein
MKNFEGIKTATKLPESIKKIMGETVAVIRPGAYRPLDE